MAKLSTLNSLRRKIDEVDRQLFKLIQYRAHLASLIVVEKTKLRLPILDPAREQKVLSNLLAYKHSTLPIASTRAVFSSLIKECRKFERTKKRAMGKELA